MMTMYSKMPLKKFKLNPSSKALISTCLDIQFSQDRHYRSRMKTSH